MGLLAQYPYLAGSLLLLAVFFGAFAIFLDQRKPMLLSGLLSMPFAFASLMFVPDYWAPTRVLEFGTGVEDLIFSFSNGGIVWVLAVAPLKRRVAPGLEPRRIVRGYVYLCLAGMLITSLAWRLGLPPMSATLVSVLALGLALLVVRTAYLPIFLAGMTGFALLYGAWISLVSFLSPRFLAHWNHAGLTGVRLPAGVPIEELLWALAFGGVWPVFMAFVFGCRLEPRPR